jgi:alpha/beta superfamily hydrolase
MKVFEQAQYLENGGERLYALLFGCEAPAAWVLLCGPFPSDRLFSLAAWCKWARFLSSHGLAAVRFDYSGTGESTGRFSDMDFERWMADIRAMAEWTAAKAGGGPLFLHGLGMGGLLAQRVFAAGGGDGLLMWSPSKEGLDILKQGLMIRLSMDMLLHRMGDRKSVVDYVQDLRSGRSVQIDGYAWSSALWATGETLVLDRDFSAPGGGIDEATGRPWRHLVLGSDLSPLIKSQSMLRAMNPRSAVVPSAPLDRDFTGFFEPNAAWIRDSAEKLTKAGRRA